MHLFVTVLHVLLALFLILVILLQPGKEGAAAFGGGGGNQNYGPRGKAHVLSQVTSVVAALFMVTSITLAWWSNHRNTSGTDIEDDIQRLEAEQRALLPTDPVNTLGSAPPATPEVPAPVGDGTEEALPADEAAVPAEAPAEATPAPDQAPPTSP
jgi:preprotein translocase subunit SecG